MKYTITFLLCLLFAEDFGQNNINAGSIYLSNDQGISWSRADAGFPQDDVVNAWTVKGEIVFAGTDHHGIMISDDHAKTWFTASKGLPSNVRVTSIAINGEAIVAGTYQHGIFVSNDNGMLWLQQSKGLNSLAIRSIVTVGKVNYAGTNDGIYVQSSDGRWRKIGGSYQVNSLAFDGSSLYAATNLGVLRTLDQGTRWENIYRRGAISKLVVNDNEIRLMDYSGLVFSANANSFVWIKEEIYFPSRSYYRLTPNGPKILDLDRHRNYFVDVPARGLPADRAFMLILHTPFGILTASGGLNDGC